MLQNAYFLAKIGADTAENEQYFADMLPRTGNYPTGPLGAAAPGWRGSAAAPERRRKATMTAAVVRLQRSSSKRFSKCEDELSKWKTTRNCACPLWNLRFSLAFEIAFLLCGERSPSDVPTFKMRLRDAHKNCVSEPIRSCVSGFANLRNFAFLCRTERFESRRCLATVTVSKGRYPTGSLDYRNGKMNSTVIACLLKKTNEAQIICISIKS